MSEGIFNSSFESKWRKILAGADSTAPPRNRRVGAAISRELFTDIPIYRVTYPKPRSQLRLPNSRWLSQPA
jgi:hypothetical protein